MGGARKSAIHALSSLYTVYVSRTEALCEAASERGVHNRLPAFFIIIRLAKQRISAGGDIHAYPVIKDKNTRLALPVVSLQLRDIYRVLTACRVYVKRTALLNRVTREPKRKERKRERER